MAEETPSYNTGFPHYDEVLRTVDKMLVGIEPTFPVNGTREQRVAAANAIMEDASKYPRTTNASNNTPRIPTIDHLNYAQGPRRPILNEDQSLKQHGHAVIVDVNLGVPGLMLNTLTDNKIQAVLNFVTNQWHLHRPNNDHEKGRREVRTLQRPDYEDPQLTYVHQRDFATLADNYVAAHSTLNEQRFNIAGKSTSNSGNEYVHKFYSDYEDKDANARPKIGRFMQNDAVKEKKLKQMSIAATQANLEAQANLQRDVTDPALVNRGNGRLKPQPLQRKRDEETLRAITSVRPGFSIGKRVLPNGAPNTIQIQPSTNPPFPDLGEDMDTLRELVRIPEVEKETEARAPQSPTFSGISIATSMMDALKDVGWGEVETPMPMPEASQTNSNEVNRHFSPTDMASQNVSSAAKRAKLSLPKKGKIAIAMDEDTPDVDDEVARGETQNTVRNSPESPIPDAPTAPKRSREFQNTQELVSSSDFGYHLPVPPPRVPDLPKVKLPVIEAPPKPLGRGFALADSSEQLSDDDTTQEEKEAQPVRGVSTSSSSATTKQFSKPALVVSDDSEDDDQTSQAPSHFVKNPYTGESMPYDPKAEAAIKAFIDSARDGLTDSQRADAEEDLQKAELHMKLGEAFLFKAQSKKKK